MNSNEFHLDLPRIATGNLPKSDFDASYTMIQVVAMSRTVSLTFVGPDAVVDSNVVLNYTESHIMISILYDFGYIRVKGCLGKAISLHRGSRRATPRLKNLGSHA